MKLLAQGLAAQGIPVVLADSRGDLSGIGEPGEGQGSALALWDPLGRQGLPLRLTVSGMGPMLLSHVLGLNALQESLLGALFAFADERRLWLIDLKDLRALLSYALSHRTELEAELGALPVPSLRAIERAVTALEQRTGGVLFGEPALEPGDLLRRAASGEGVVSCLDLRQLSADPPLCGALLLWLLSVLAPEDPAEPGELRLALFLDEADSLLRGLPARLQERLVLLVRYLGERGIGVFFVSRQVSALPAELTELAATRIVLRPVLSVSGRREESAAAAILGLSRAQAAVLSQLPAGEALVLLPQESGPGGCVERLQLRLPRCRLGGLTDAERAGVRRQDPLGIRYEQAVDRDSAYEMLGRLSDEEESSAQGRQERQQRAKEQEREDRQVQMARRRAVRNVSRAAAGSVGRQLGREIGRPFGSAGSYIAGSIGSSIARGIVGTLLHF